MTSVTLFVSEGGKEDLIERSCNAAQHIVQQRKSIKNVDPLFLTQSFWTPFAGVQRPEGLQRLMTLVLIKLRKVTTQGDIGWQTFGKICGHKVGGNLDAKANQGSKAMG